MIDKTKDASEPPLDWRVMPQEVSTEGGEWVKDYTQRGSPRQGNRQYKWRSKKQARQETAAAWAIAVAMVLAVFVPALIGA